MKLVFQIFFIIFTCNYSFAEEPVTITDQDHVVSLKNKNIRYLKEYKINSPSEIPHLNSMIWQDVLEPKEKIPNLGVAQASFVVSFSLQNDSNQSRPLVFEIYNHVLAKVTGYIVHENGQIDQFKTGAAIKPSEKARPTVTPMYYFQIAAKEKVIFYLSIESFRNLLPIYIEEPQIYERSYSLSLVFYLAILGGGLAFCIYSLFLYFTSRELYYLLYAISVLGYSGLTISNKNLWTLLSLENHLDLIASKGLGFSALLFGLGTLLFSIYFLKLHIYNKKIATFYRVIVYGVVLVMLPIVVVDPTWKVVFLCASVFLAIVQITFISTDIYLLFSRNGSKRDIFIHLGSECISVLGMSMVFLIVSGHMDFKWDFIPTLANFIRGSVFAISFAHQLKQTRDQLAVSNTLLIESNEGLKKADKLKDEFLANTSHELKTPLNGIIGIAESLIDGIAGKLPTEVEKNLGLIVHSGKRLSFLVNDILDFSKIRNQNLSIQPIAIGIREIVEFVLSQCRISLKNKNIELINEIGDNVPLIYADEYRLQQIIFNLVGNSMKFTKSGKIVVKARVTESKEIEVCVQDTGIGISKNHLASLFTPFSQVDGSNTREQGGVGLGLSITKSLVELHSGRIWVESELGVGSSFYFTVPLYDGQEIIPKTEIDKRSFMVNVNNTSTDPMPKNDIPGIAKVTANEPQPQRNFQVLIVDDEPVNQQVLINQLSLANYDVKIASNGLQALEILEKEGKPDIVLLDVMMPHLTGFETANAIRQKYNASELPIILVTAKNQLQDLMTGFQEGANDYLSKPINKSELLARVKTHLQVSEYNLALQEANSQLAKLLECAKDLQQFTSQKDAIFYVIKLLKEEIFEDNLENAYGQYKTIENEKEVLKDFALHPVDNLDSIDQHANLTESIIEIKNKVWTIYLVWEKESIGWINLILKKPMQKLNQLNFANTLIHDLSLGLQNIGFKKGLEDKVMIRTEQLRIKNSRIESMLQNVNQGIFLFNSDLKILPDYSTYLETILQKQGLHNQLVMQEIFSNTRFTGDEISQFENAFQTILSEDKINYMFNRHILPKEFVKDLGSAEIVCEVDWLPIVNENEVVEEMLVVMRDVTELRELRKVQAAIAQERDMINHIVELGADQFFTFYDELCRKIEMIKGTLLAERDDRQIARLLHTDKGLSRSFGLSFISDALHYCETSFAKVQESGDSSAFLKDLEELTAISKHYEEIAIKRLKFHRNPTSRTSSIFALFEDLVSGCKDLCQNLGKSFPRLVKTGPDMHFAKPSSMLTMQGAMIHLVRNSIDHGFDANSKDNQIEIATSLADNVAKIVIKDNGKGLNLRILHQKGVEKGLLDSKSQPSDQDVAQLIFHPNLSTAEKVTQVSGRGVGMDAVLHDIHSLGGSLELALEAKNPSGYAPFSYVISLPSSIFV